LFEDLELFKTTRTRACFLQVASLRLVILLIGMVFWATFNQAPLLQLDRRRHRLGEDKTSLC
jgi:hypothetical protein